MDVRNPYGQLASADTMIEGSEGFCVEPKMRDASNRLFAFHILEKNRKEKNGVEPSIHGLVLSSSDLKTYRRIGHYCCKGPVQSQYPAAAIKRATITVI